MQYLLLLLSILSIDLTRGQCNQNYPIVLLHGITSDKSELTSVSNWITENLPNKVFNIEIGNGKPDSIFKTMDWQLNELCYEIYNIPELENGFHFIGMSQGGLLARGYVERCNKFPVINLITWVSPHGGVYGFDEKYFEFKNIYKPFYQNIYSFSGYWKDPFRYNMYLASASFLPYLNNEKENEENKYPYKANDMLFDFDYDYNYNYEYIYDYELVAWSSEQNKQNMLSLTNFVMIWSPNDDVLSPPQSGKFSFYKIIDANSDIEMDISKIEPGIETSMETSIDANMEIEELFLNEISLPIIDLFDSQQYIEDWLGLRTLYETNRLHIFETNCTHSGHKTEECFPQLEELTFNFLI